MPNPEASNSDVGNCGLEVIVSLKGEHMKNFQKDELFNRRMFPIPLALRDKQTAALVPSSNVCVAYTRGFQAKRVEELAVAVNHEAS